MKRLRELTGAAALGLLVLLVSGTARAGQEDYPNFADTKGLTLSGNAAAVKTPRGTVLRITPAEGADDGSVFASETINASNFSTAFVFRMSDRGGEADPKGHVGADGITFAIQPISASLGGTGEGLGIGGVSPSVAIEFDTWDDTCADYPEVCDPNSNHVGIDVNGNVHSVKTASVEPAMDDGEEWYAWIDYDGTTLEVRLGESAIRPVDPRLSYKIDIPSILGVGSEPLSKAYVGFTASTGDGWQNHDILSWNYTDKFVDGGVHSTDAGTPPPKDAGMQTAAPEQSGCSCKSAGVPRGARDGILGSLALLAVCARRWKRPSPCPRARPSAPRSS